MNVLDGHLIGIQYLAIAYLTSALAEQDIIVIGAESPFAKAWDMMAELLGCAMDELRRDETAERAAEELAARLAAMGYFRMCRATAAKTVRR